MSELVIFSTETLDETETSVENDILMESVNNFAHAQRDTCNEEMINSQELLEDFESLTDDKKNNFINTVDETSVSVASVS